MVTEKSRVTGSRLKIHATAGWRVRNFSSIDLTKWHETQSCFIFQDRHPISPTLVGGL